MRYGVCTWIFGDQRLGEVAAGLKELGYDGVELAGNLERYDAQEVKDVLGDHGLAVLSLTPENVDLAHPDKGVRQKAVDYYLRLLDFANAVGNPLVCCHGAVGRIRAVSNHEEEWAFFVDGVRRIAEHAQRRELRVAMEVLNRYEAHLLNTAHEALRFVEEVGHRNVGVLLDAYHMNIEEADLRSAILAAKERLLLFHVADSNRQAIGHGHTGFQGIMHTLRDIGYEGPVILECTAPGPDPFTPAKRPGWLEVVWDYVAESIQLLRLYEAMTHAEG